MPRTSTKSSGSAVSRYRLGAYVRLSPSDEIREEGSLVSHPQRINSFVEFKNTQEPGWGELVEVYTDKDYSGKDTNRPSFKRMLQDIKLGRINAVIVTELSRISRDVKDFCNFWEFLKLYNATFISLKENFDTTTPIGEMMVIQAISFAQFERKTIVQRIKDGARARAERGLCNGAIKILGLDSHPTKKNHLVANEQEAVIVRHIFDMFMELGSTAKLRDYLNEAGIRTKRFVTEDGRQRGGGIWTRASLHSLLTNVRVIGKVEVNRANRDVDEGDVSAFERYKLVNATWPAIIDEQVYAAVQAKLFTNKRYAKVHQHVYRLAGVIECGLCGRELSGQAANGKNGKYFYYAHSRNFSVHGKHRERCRLERTSAVRVEEAVIARLMELAQNPKLLTQLARDSTVNTDDLQKEIDQVIATKEQERRRLDRIIDNLVSTLGELPEGVKPQTVLTKVAEIETQRDQLAKSIADLRDERRQVTKKVVNVEHVVRVFRHFQKDYSTRPVHEQREILWSVVSRVVVQEDGIRVFYFGSAREDELIDAAPEKIEKRLLGEDTEKSSGSGAFGLTTCRSGVRPVSRMVEDRGFEPLTPSLQS